MLLSKDPGTTIIPPKIKLIYADFKLISEAHYFKIFSAVSSSSNQAFSIRVLDFNSEFYCANPSLAATLFLQELLRLCTLHPETVIVEDFEICDKAMAFVAKPYLPLSRIIKEEKEAQQVDIDKLIRDVLTDLNFLVYKMRLNSKSTSIHIDSDNIYQMLDNKTFYLGDWAKGLGTMKVLVDASELNSKVVCDSNGEKEVQNFAIKMLELCGAKKEDVQDVQNLMLISNPNMYTAGLDGILKGLNLSEGAKKTLKCMLTKESGLRLKLSDFGDENRKKLLDEAKANEISSLIGQELQKRSDKISRFRTVAGVWNYWEELNIDGIAFKTSKNVRITGVGLYIPKGEGILKAKVKVVEGASVEGNTLSSKEFELIKDMSGANNSICSFMLDKHVNVFAGKVYSLVSEFNEGPYTEKGIKGKAEIQTKEGIIFEFVDCQGSKNGTDVNMGQFPEIYFSY